MLSVVCWRWKPPPGYRSQFSPDTVNVLRRMVARHYQKPHRFICVTDDADGIDPGVEVVKLWNDFADVPNPSGSNNPSCYRRLRMFAPDAAEYFGERFVSVDLDVVIVNDMTKLWDRPEDFVIWGKTSSCPFNGGMMMLRSGTRTKVWEQFDPVESPKKGRALRYFGSDQAWIAYCLGTNEAMWTRADGVISYRMDMKEGQLSLPANAKIVLFHGRHDPWQLNVQNQSPWIRQHYR